MMHCGSSCKMSLPCRLGDLLYKQFWCVMLHALSAHEDCYKHDLRTTV